MGGAGGLGGLGGVALGLGVGSTGAGDNAVRLSTGVAVAAASSSSPAATLGLSSDGLALLAQTASMGGLVDTNSNQSVFGVGSLAGKLVEAAVISAMLDDADEEDKEKSGQIATALVVAAAVQAYQQVAGQPGTSVITAVPGANTHISITASA